jgi:hypothetical protein
VTDHPTSQDEHGKFPDRAKWHAWAKSQGFEYDHYKHKWIRPDDGRYVELQLITDELMFFYEITTNCTPNLSDHEKARVAKGGVAKLILMTLPQLSIDDVLTLKKAIDRHYTPKTEQQHSPSLSIEFWHDGKSPRMTIAYDEPMELFNQSKTYLNWGEIAKMLDDFLKRHDVPKDAKAAINKLRMELPHALASLNMDADMGKPYLKLRKENPDAR